jgi:hypothetical protein
MAFLKGINFVGDGYSAFEGDISGARWDACLCKLKLSVPCS